MDEKTKIKISKSKKGVSIKHDKQFKKGHTPWNKGGHFKQLQGKNNPNWKGGYTINDFGYILVKSPNHPFCDHHGYIRKHRLIMEKHIGRYLSKKELVHHRGIKYPFDSIENRQDNRIENLQIISHSKHMSLHHKNKKYRLGKYNKNNTKYQRKCWKCKHIKKIYLFVKNKHCPLGYNYTCKSCQRKINHIRQLESLNFR